MVRDLARLKELDLPILLGVSRKRAIGAATGRAEPKERVMGSVTAHVMGAMNGADIVRVHDVAAHVEAMRMVAAVRYPPKGVRGISSVTRATRFGRVPGYAAHADAEMCVIVQVETAATLERIEAIAAVDGVDALFVGPGDLAATLGYPGEPGHPEFKRVVEDTLRRIRAAGKPAGILTPDLAFARKAIDCGSLFTAIGVDLALLARGSENLLAAFNARA